MTITNLIGGDWQLSNKQHDDDQRLGNQKTKGNGGGKGGGGIDKADFGGKWDGERRKTMARLGFDFVP